ncbi:MAG: flavoprotein [Planctomycetota bacterium]
MSSSKHIILGVSASIALHRALDIGSELRKGGHKVSVLMSPNAKQLISPLAFQAMTLSKVYHQMWETVSDLDHDHIRLAQDADLMVLAPATAGTIGKIANGIADNILTTTAMTFDGPRLFAPAMNWRMWANEAVQANTQLLQNRAWELISPADGDLACGETGPGRLAEVSFILDRIEAAWSRPKKA